MTNWPWGGGRIDSGIMEMRGNKIMLHVWCWTCSPHLFPTVINDAVCLQFIQPASQNPQLDYQMELLLATAMRFKFNPNVAVAATHVV